MELVSSGKYNPLEFWYSFRMSFPILYGINKCLMAYSSSNALQESIFSIVTDTMDSKRFRMAESPALFEAVLALRVHNSFKKQDAPPVSTRQSTLKIAHNVIEVDDDE